jgi:hypothetical protein
MKSAFSAKCNSVGAVDLCEMECPECGSSLTFHQPTQGRPDRLLATCEDCENWFLTTDGSETLVRLLITLDSKASPGRR